MKRRIQGLCAAVAGICFATFAQAETQRAVVFDIDGTLTPSVYAMWHPRDGAAAVATDFADAGYTVVYVTARVRMFQSGVGTWLAENGFPAGPLHLTQSKQDRDDHAAFKMRVLQEYIDADWEIAAAFGDSSTDFRAYGGSNVPQDRVFALRRRGADTCQRGRWQGCYDGWDALRPVLAPLLTPKD